MGEFVSAVVTTENGEVELYSSDPKVIGQMMKVVMKQNQKLGEPIKLDATVEQTLTICNFENKDRWLYWADFVLNILNKNGWQRDNRNDILYSGMHFIKEV